MDQTNKVKLNNKIGELNQTIAFYFWTMIDSFFINFIPSTIGCNKPNQPILYGPLLLWKAPITNRSMKAKSPTVPSKYNVMNEFMMEFILTLCFHLVLYSFSPYEHSSNYYTTQPKTSENKSYLPLIHMEYHNQ